MSQRQSLVRKVIYVVIIIALLIPLSILSQPATRSTSGGLLARLRDENRLSQANLGEIDPTSEAMKLATLGMRGPAAYLLWQKAWDYKKKENWTGLTAVLEQITHLQPNYESVWDFQSWNLSYNISVEFDDYRDRYYWVIRGIDFLKKGTVYNEDSPALLNRMGWMISQKIGRSDEHVQFRQLFREDDKFNAGVPVALRDNWLVGKGWYQKGIDVVDAGRPLGKKSPLLYFTYPAKCQMSYAEALESEGTFGETAREEWRRGGEEWAAYGARDIPTSFGTTIRLNDLETTREAADELQAEFDAATEGIRDEILEEKLAKLTEAQQDAVRTPYEQRNAEQRQIAMEVGEQADVSNEEIAERVPEDQRERVKQLAEQLTEMSQRAGQISGYRMTVNFDYWRDRCAAEQTEDASIAREQIYEGNAAFEEAEFEVAREKYEEGMRRWRAVMDASPTLADDNITAEDLVEVIKRYRRILKQLDEPVPDDFVLADFWEVHKPDDYEE
ncbi:MAG: hypothetical protein KDA63_12665 [Planctomycetales bacterium]|nr:hypothetical protein [Planctomycetales bacterium]